MQHNPDCILRPTVEATATPSDSSGPMTGGPTSVNPGLAPTAVPWGYPHLEVYALTRNTTNSVYRKWRGMNAPSESDFTPAGRDMALVGGDVDTTIAPSIAVIPHLYLPGGSKGYNKTEVHIYGHHGQTGYYKFHSVDEIMTPWGYLSPPSGATSRKTST
ncbi:fucose-specific lectin [Apiospora saccharicola]|uniref:Fucose-specific lectin n=1 Tax=Apiospora saccharicola TaxID=335842 RepID=A0ABR1W6X3_9PEZI